MRFLSSAQHLFSLRFTKASASAGRPFGCEFISEFVSWLNRRGLSAFGSHSSLAAHRVDFRMDGVSVADGLVARLAVELAAGLVAGLVGVELVR